MTSKYRSFKTGQFNKLLEKLPQEIQKQASESFAKWKEDPNSVGFKPLGISNNEVWSAQVNTRYRALAKKQKDENGKTSYVWFWVGSHEDYNNVIKKLNHIQGNIASIRSSSVENKKPNNLKPN
jgi:mRNA-degrading endonuclease RelE of RelBE toxin-antitoxin system